MHNIIGIYLHRSYISDYQQTSTVGHIIYCCTAGVFRPVAEFYEFGYRKNKMADFLAFRLSLPNQMLFPEITCYH